MDKCIIKVEKILDKEAFKFSLSLDEKKERW